MRLPYHSLHRKIGAWTILSVFVLGWLTGVTHRLLSHHDHAGKPDCSATYDARATHIHNEKYANDHCSLCAYVLSTPELLSFSAVIQKPVEEPLFRSLFPVVPVFAGNTKGAAHLRGPPASI